MFEDKFSIRTKTMKRSAIRELLKLVLNPEIISFAGGMPDPSLFPIKLLGDAVKSVLEREGKRAVQYGPTEGHQGLKEELIKRLETRRNIKINENEILITTASQQGLDLVSKIFIDPEDIVIVGLPTYLGGLGAFHSYRARFIGIPLDDNGMRVDLVEEKLRVLRRGQHRVKFIYVIPDFQNPAGVTLSIERRKKIIALAEKYNILILEDTPYRELRYRGESIPSLFALAPRDRVVSLYTFSKVLFPGLRLGYILGDKEIINQLVIAKQSTDLCTPPFTQAILCEILKRDVIDEHIKKLVVRYRDKRECMLNSLDKYMPELPDLSWTKPDGGLFLWVTLPNYMNTEKLFSKALEKKVAYVAGSYFYYNDSGKNTLRLNFSYPTLKLIIKGIQRLGGLIKEEAE
ncbi:PLP-dependent aminotransferase family protein [candidate division WOR-3 bacterium]|nr:PLP-dependent aminotransferase family protein [candidate division WOR-3 bacterium]